MNFELTPQQKAVQQSARQFAQTVLQETVLEDDAAGRFPEEAYKKMGEMGFVGLPFPKEYGGQGGDYLSYVLALEEIYQDQFICRNCLFCMYFIILWCSDQ